MGYNNDVNFLERLTTNKETMNKNIIILAVTPGLIALAALALSIRSQVNADSIIGFGCVLMLAAVATLEYRINWRRILSR